MLTSGSVRANVWYVHVCMYSCEPTETRGGLWVSYFKACCLMSLIRLLVSLELAW